MKLPILSLLIWLPIAGSALLWLMRSKSVLYSRLILLSSQFLSVLLCGWLCYGFNTHKYAMQYREVIAWVPALNINYALGVDGISLVFIALTIFVNLCLQVLYLNNKNNSLDINAILLLMQGLMIGIFAATDAMLFYIFWEAILIPLYLTIIVWGGDRKQYAATKFMLYTLLGSLSLLFVLIFLYRGSHSFAIDALYHLRLSFRTQLLLFVGFVLAFGIKLPLWPLHSWLPDAHTDAPIAGSVVLAALMLKVGGYGFVRFCLPIVPAACRSMSWLIIALSLIAIIYIGLIALTQTNLKRLIAYSSIAHMGFVSLGLYLVFILIGLHNSNVAIFSLTAAIFQMLAHGVTIMGLFLAIGMLFRRYNSYDFMNVRGVAHSMPLFATLFLILSLSVVSFPGTAGFVGEFMVILSAFKLSFWLAFAAALSLVISAAYMLRVYKCVFMGEPSLAAPQKVCDLGFSEGFVLTLIAVAVVAMGIYPQSIIKILMPSVTHFMQLL